MRKTVPKDVSSPLTFVNKFIKPLIFPGVLVYASYKFNFPLYSNSILLLIAPALILKILFLVIMPAIKVKKVAYDDHYLYVSSYFKEIQVPLTDIANVSQSFWQRARSRELSESVTIFFKQPTVFGAKIFFNPSVRFFGGGEHPVVAELKRVIGDHYLNSAQQFSRPT